MKIKRNKKALQLQGKEVNVELNTDSSNIQIGISYKDKEVLVSVPGEYEYSGVGITALEIPQEEYQGAVSIAKTSIENINIIFVASNLSLNKEQKDTLGNTEILVVSDIEVKTLKKLIDALDPSVVLIHPNGAEGTEELLKSIKKEFGVDEIENESTGVYKSKDFESEEELPIVFKSL